MANRWQKLVAKAQPVIKAVARHYKMANVSDSAAVLAYYLLLSLFPALLVVASSLPFLQLDAKTVMEGIEPIVPADIYQMLGPIIHAFLTQRSGGVLSVGVVVAIWSSSRAVAAFQRTVNRAYGVGRTQNALINRVGAFFWMVVLILLLFALMLFFSFSQLIMEHLIPLFHFPEYLLSYFNAARWPVTFVVTFFILAILFYFVPNARVKWRYVWPGALTAALGWLLLSQAFSLYLKYFMHSIDSYKTIGTFIVLMFWLNFTGMILMFGAVLNASVQELVDGPAEEQTRLRSFIQQHQPKKNPRHD